ncbi:unnamed protein product [Amoebophrya sp. A120]|nr:unnamed protein product [Amoebophrya sp. A120]|eukprot:GSA120T00010510001.1
MHTLQIIEQEEELLIMDQIKHEFPAAATNLLSGLIQRFPAHVVPILVKLAEDLLKRRIMLKQGGGVLAGFGDELGVEVDSSKIGEDHASSRAPESASGRFTGGGAAAISRKNNKQKTFTQDASDCEVFLVLLTVFWKKMVETTLKVDQFLPTTSGGQSVARAGANVDSSTSGACVSPTRRAVAAGTVGDATAAAAGPSFIATSSAAGSASKMLAAQQDISEEQLTKFRSVLEGVIFLAEDRGLVSLDEEELEGAGEGGASAGAGVVPFQQQNETANGGARGQKHRHDHLGLNLPHVVEEQHFFVSPTSPPPNTIHRGNPAGAAFFSPTNVASNHNLLPPAHPMSPTRPSWSVAKERRAWKMSLSAARGGAGAVSSGDGHWSRSQQKRKSSLRDHAMLTASSGKKLAAPSAAVLPARPGALITSPGSPALGPAIASSPVFAGNMIAAHQQLEKDQVAAGMLNQDSAAVDSPILPLSLENTAEMMLTRSGEKNHRASPSSGVTRSNAAATSSSSSSAAAGSSFLPAGSAATEKSQRPALAHQEQPKPPSRRKSLLVYNRREQRCLEQLLFQIVVSPLLTDLLAVYTRLCPQRAGLFVQVVQEAVDDPLWNGELQVVRKMNAAAATATAQYQEYQDEAVDEGRRHEDEQKSNMKEQKCSSVVQRKTNPKTRTLDEIIEFLRDFHRSDQSFQNAFAEYLTEDEDHDSRGFAESTRKDDFFNIETIRGRGKLIPPDQQQARAASGLALTKNHHDLSLLNPNTLAIVKEQQEKALRLAESCEVFSFGGPGSTVVAPGTRGVLEEEEHFNTSDRSPNAAAASSSTKKQSRHINRRRENQGFLCPSEPSSQLIEEKKILLALRDYLLRDDEGEESRPAPPKEEPQASHEDAGNANAATLACKTYRTRSGALSLLEASVERFSDEGAPRPLGSGGAAPAGAACTTTGTTSTTTTVLGTMLPMRFWRQLRGHLLTRLLHSILNMEKVLILANATSVPRLDDKDQLNHERGPDALSSSSSSSSLKITTRLDPGNLNPGFLDDIGRMGVQCLHSKVSALARLASDAAHHRTSESNGEGDFYMEPAHNQDEDHEALLGQGQMDKQGRAAGAGQVDGEFVLSNEDVFVNTEITAAQAPRPPNSSFAQSQSRRVRNTAMTGNSGRQIPALSVTVSARGGGGPRGGGGGGKDVQHGRRVAAQQDEHQHQQQPPPVDTLGKRAGRFSRLFF